MDLKSIKGVEIFAAGKWNGDEYTVADLDEMVRAFSENHQTLKPSIKLGHSEEQKLLQKDGYPAAGWISNVYRIGAKLYADFVDIPSKIYELIERKAYRKVSSEIYWNIDINGKAYKRMLSAVALLGGDMPAVSTLNDILSLYGVRKADKLGVYASETSAHMLKEYTLEIDDSARKHMGKTESEIKLEYDLKAAADKASDLEAQLKKISDEAAEKAKENDDLRKFKAESDKRAADAEKAAAEAKLDQTVSEMETNGLVTPAMKPYVRALLGEEKKEYAFQDEKLSKPEMISKVLRLYSESQGINFGESSKKGDHEKAKSKEAELEQKVQKYAQENKTTYRAAYVAVMNQEKAK